VCLDLARHRSGNEDIVSSRRQYILNILWSWIGVAALILNGMLVSPYLIRRLGADTYGIWALGLSLVEYFWMIDLGVRPATVKLTAEYHASGKWDALNSLLSTAVAYSAAMGLLALLLISFNVGAITRFFHITHPRFVVLIQVVSFSWAFGLVFNVFGAAIEGFQRFDITNRIFIGFTLIRSLTLVALVSSGYGLASMSVGLLITQFMMYAALFVALSRRYPGLRISPQLMTKAAGREIWLYARQVVSAMLSARLLQSAIPSLIARFLPIQNVTYYTVTQKVLEYASEGIGRIGLITAPRASEWMALGYHKQILSLAEYGNRYCLTWWLFFGTFFLVYGEPLFRVWINPDFATQAAVLLPIMLFGQTLWMGQFTSAAILMGIGRYGEYSASLMVEAILTVLGFGLVLPFYGLPAALVISSTMIFLNRCVNLSHIFAKEFKISQTAFLWSIYRTPIALGIVEAGGLWAIRKTLLPGRDWRELIIIGAMHALIYCAAAFWLVLERDHRTLVLEKGKEKWRGIACRVKGSEGPTKL
jgi:O-antigen/teichoic acid export membrane protein